MAVIDVTLLTKPGCHLCDDARAAVKAVVAGYSTAPALIDVTELSILDDQALYDEHVEDIPVVLIDGRVHTFWRVDEQRLRTALDVALAAST